MECNFNDVTVLHDEEAHRFETDVNGLRALITYRPFPDRIVFAHTEVPSALEGKGLAAKLARTALDFARANCLHVVLLCPYVSGFIREHPQYRNLVRAEDLQSLPPRE